MMIGTLPSWRRMRQTSRPLSSGSMRSSRIRSGRELRALATPSAPSWATVTAYPSFLRLKLSLSRMVASSSTTRMRLGTLAQLHDPPGMQEDDVLGDVGHPIRDPLQVLGKKEQDGGALHVGRVLDHEADELVPDLVIKGVNVIVAFGDRASPVLVRHDHESPLAQLAMQFVDLLVTRDDFLGERVVAIDQGAHGFGDRLLDHAAHTNDACPQVGKFLIEKRPGGGHDGSS